MIELVKESLGPDVGLSIKGICEVLSLSRATLYRRSGAEALDDDTELRDEIQRIALDPYGRLQAHRKGACEAGASGKPQAGSAADARG